MEIGNNDATSSASDKAKKQSMNKNYSIVVPCLIGAFLLLIVEVYWADWIIQSIFNKDYNNWAIFGVLVLTSLVTPKSLRGITTLGMLLSTIFIWTTM